nr:MAG TPA: hypothetical protein [Caudoviricetes sp.]
MCKMCISFVNLHIGKNIETLHRICIFCTNVQKSQ